MGGQYCGVIGNGCGGTQDCGACANGMACATTGTSAHICPGSTTTTTPTCTGATKTTISGTVYDPAGVNPLYNVIVYIPSGALPTLAEGVSCDKCGAEVNAPFASALTDVNGHFSMTLEPVPSTTNVPLVMQVGKWRRQITIPSLQTCKDNPLTDKNQTRLPRTSAEGHIPRIAVTTGGSDALECLLRRIGIADTRVHQRCGRRPRSPLRWRRAARTAFMAGGTFAPATTLWSNRTKLANYDVILHVVRRQHERVHRHEAAGEHRQRDQLRQLGRPRLPVAPALLLAADEPDVRRHGGVHRHLTPPTASARTRST